jgi:hypothetical protein
MKPYILERCAVHASPLYKHNYSVNPVRFWLRCPTKDTFRLWQKPGSKSQSVGIVDIYIYESVGCWTCQNANVDGMTIEIGTDVFLGYPKFWPSVVDRLLGFVVNRYWGEAVVDII